MRWALTDPFHARGFFAAPPPPALPRAVPGTFERAVAGAVAVGVASLLTVKFNAVMSSDIKEEFSTLPPPPTPPLPPPTSSPVCILGNDAMVSLSKSLSPILSNPNPGPSPNPPAE